jgi:hypothetical protein
MRDEEIGKTKVILQVGEQVQDLRLNGNIQSRSRLVTDDEPRLERKSPRDTDALTLAT